MTGILGMCHICGKPAMRSCAMCGRPACKDHYNIKARMCDSCASGRFMKK